MTTTATTRMDLVVEQTSFGAIIVEEMRYVAEKVLLMTFIALGKLSLTKIDHFYLMAGN